MTNLSNQAFQYTPGENQVSLTYKDDPKNENGLHFLLWSGGCDSTLLLYELLEAYGCERVVAVSYKYPWLGDKKYETEKMHREAFKSKVKLRGEKFANIRHTEIEFNQKTMSGDHLLHHGGGYIQAVAWLLSIPIYTLHGAMVYTGIINGDGLPLMIQEYSALFKNLSNLMNRDIHLRIPYLSLTKSQVIEKLFHYDIYEESWYCENPPSIGKSCHKCTPCITHLSALTALILTTEDKFIRLKAEKELDKIKKGIAEKQLAEKKEEENKICLKSPQELLPAEKV